MAESPISPDEHRQRILDAIEPMGAFPQPLMEALGLACAADIHADVSLPGFDNSAMDGYAVRFEDVATATVEAPTVLPVVGEIGAGTARVHALAPGTSVKIMTGAPVPAGADTSTRRPTVASARCGSPRRPGPPERTCAAPART
jgi:molybdopterin molybdotransferase